MRTLITCHANADCDSFAAMLAARHLYSGSFLYFPGTQEHGLNKIFKNLDKSIYNFIESQQIYWDDYDRLVIVDTREKGRVKHVEPLLNREGIIIDIWDHHPPSSDDIENASLHFAQSGAVTSMLCGELQKSGIELSEEEATLLGLGIYSDTGSFSYSSTKEMDFQAAAWLLGQGMDVTRLNDMVCHEMTSQHVHALNSLLESAHTYMINNIPVVIADTSVADYLGDFASLAHKVMEMEKFSVLFALGVMGDRIQVVGRSRVNEVNVGEICASLGGGGHEYAASASIKCKMINDVREHILRELHKRAYPEKTARDYMSTPAIGIESEASINQADELMLHFGLKAIPVFHPGTRACAGILDAQMAARANAHGLGKEPVAEYMQRRVSTLAPEAGISELSEIIVGARQRLVPIVVDNEIIGVVTRTDLINVFASDSASLATVKHNAKSQNIRKLITEKLDKDTIGLLQLAGNIGDELGLPVYAVGGFVRDLLIGRSNKDIDLVVEGRGLVLARELAKRLGGRAQAHPEFLTSSVIYKDKDGLERHIDVATARLEYYECPAALPTVELSSIKMDLFRRDFSVNALAVRLDGAFYGELVDFFGGRRDIKDKLIRVLHTLSFVEDPTRCMRAVRFEQRYNFKIGPGTEKLMKNILPMGLLAKLSPHRIFNEYALVCQEDAAAACFERINSLGIFKALCPRLELNPGRRAIIKRVQEILAWYKLLFFEEKAEPWICYFYGLCAHMNYTDTQEIYKCLGLPDNRKAEILQQREKLKNLKPKLMEWQKREDQGNLNIGELCDLLENVNLEILLFGMAVLDSAGLERNISRYITQWRHMKPDINGHDLKKIGIEPGPLYGDLLKKALYAKLAGAAPNAESQLQLVAAEVKKARQS